MESIGTEFSRIRTDSGAPSCAKSSNSFRIADCGHGVTAISPFMSCAQGLGKVYFNLRDSLWGAEMVTSTFSAL